MHEDDEQIRRIAESIEASRQVEASNATSAEQAIRSQELARARVTQERVAEVRSICGRFTVWASQNYIPYNSPSIFAPGWLLGRYNGSPSYNVSHQGIQDSGASTVSLLVKRGGSVRELVVRSATKKGAGHHQFSRRAKLDSVPLPTIHESIARFSADYQIEWQ